MGDADDPVVELSAQEVGAWMDEAVDVIDEGFENLFALITDLNERTKGIVRELNILKSLRRVFVALNVFIVPVIIAVLLCYGTRESISGSKIGVETGFQVLVMVLMLLSSSVGLPFYIIAICESFKSSETVNEEQENHIPNEYPLLFERLLSQVTNESSLEQLNDFARQLNEFMPQMVRQDLQRMVIAENDSLEQRVLPPPEHSSENEMESAATDVSNSEQPDESKQDHCLDSEEKKPNDGSRLYEFEVCMNDLSPDLAVRIEPANKAKQRKATENEKVEEQHEKVEEQHKKVEEQHKKVEEQHKNVEEQQEKVEEQHEKVEEQHKNVEEQRKNVEEQRKNVEELHKKVEEQQVIKEPPKRRDVATSTVERITYVTHINGYPEIRQLKL